MVNSDDDLPPSHSLPPPSHSAPPPPNSLPPRVEAYIRQIEKEAYLSVLRAFKVQADELTREKESLLTDVRRDLRISNEEHTELRARVNTDDTVLRIWESRQWRRMHPSTPNAAQVVHDTLASHNVSDSTKTHQPNQPISSQSFAGTSSHLHPQAGPSHPVASSPAKRRFVPRVEGKTPELNLRARGQVMNRLPPNSFNPKSLIGRKVRTRWPTDNTFYEAFITKYDKVKGLHCFVYDMDTPEETWEWVKFSEILPEDIQWIGEDPGINRTIRPNSDPQQGTSLAKNTVGEDVKTSQNETGETIQILNTNDLVREVEERVLTGDVSDPQEVERAKRVLKEHEQGLVEAIKKLEDIDDGEDEGAL